MLPSDAPILPPHLCLRKRFLPFCALGGIKNERAAAGFNLNFLPLWVFSFSLLKEIRVTSVLWGSLGFSSLHNKKT